MIDKSLKFYLAQVVSNDSLNKGKIKVRILPHLIEIDDNDLPEFPPFSDDTLPNCIPGEYVWVIANEKFTFGFIFGNASVYTEDEMIDYTKLVDDFATVVLDNGGEYIAAKYLKIVHISSHTLMYVNVESGQSGIININGPHLSLSKDKAMLGNKESKIILTEEEVLLQGKVIRLAGQVRLGAGNSGLVVSTSLGTVLNIGEEGTKAYVSKDILV